MTTISAVFDKDGSDTLDYMRDWAEWLVGGDTIVTSTWTTSPPGLTKTRESHDDTTATVWLSAGDTGQIYTVTNTISTAQGRTVERSFQLYVRDL